MSKATPEERVEWDIRQLFEAVGIIVCKMSQGVRGHFDPTAARADGGVGKFKSDRGGTRQTRGISDLELWIPQASVRITNVSATVITVDGAGTPSLRLGKFEVKTPEGLQEFEALRRRPLHDILVNAPSKRKAWDHVQEQLRYAAYCAVAGIAYGRGAMPEAYAFLVGLGLAKDQGQQRGHPPLLIRARSNALEEVEDILRRGRSPS